MTAAIIDIRDPAPHDATEAAAAAALIFGDRPRHLRRINPRDGRDVESVVFSASDDAGFAAWLAGPAHQQNVYFGHAEGKPGATRRTRDDLAAVYWLHVDIDPREGEDVDSARIRIHRLLTSELPEGVPPPSALIDSGRGFYGLWRLEEPLVDFNEAEQRNRWLAQQLGGDAAHDVSRILRLPGTVNHKPAAQGRRARLLKHEHGAVYTPDRFGSVPLSERGSGKRDGGAAAPATELDTAEAKERARDFLGNRDPAVEGQGGDDWTYRTLCICMDMGLSAAATVDIMTEPGGWNENCCPPWELDELWQKAENAKQYRLSASGSQTPEVDFGGVDNIPEPRYVPRKSRLRWLSDADAQKQPDWLLRPWLPEIGVAAIAGQSRAAKTFVALDLAHALAMRECFFDKRARERVGVLFIAAEAPGTIGPRLEALRLYKLSGADASSLPVTWADLDDVPRAPDLSSRVAMVVAAIEECIVDAVAEMRQRYGLRLGAVIIDTVGAAFGVPDSDDEAAKLVVGALGVISRKYGLLVLPVCHFGKDDRSGVTGTYYWTAGFDVVIAVTGNICEKTGDVKDRRIAITKNKLDEQGPISAFELQSVNLGLDRDGVEVSSAIVKATVAKAKPEKPSPHADLYRECMFNAMVDKTVEIDGRDATERLRVLAEFKERVPGSKDSGNVSKKFAGAERWAGVTVIHRDGVDYVMEDQWPMMPRG